MIRMLSSNGVWGGGTQRHHFYHGLSHWSGPKSRLGQGSRIPTLVRGDANLWIQFRDVMTMMTMTMTMMMMMMLMPMMLLLVVVMVVVLIMIIMIMMRCEWCEMNTTEMESTVFRLGNDATCHLSQDSGPGMAGAIQIQGMDACWTHQSAQVVFRWREQKPLFFLQQTSNLTSCECGVLSLDKSWLQNAQLVI